jgi:hypothetical protein
VHVVIAIGPLEQNTINRPPMGSGDRISSLILRSGYKAGTVELACSTRKLKRNLGARTNVKVAVGEAPSARPVKMSAFRHCPNQGSGAGCARSTMPSLFAESSGGTVWHSTCSVSFAWSEHPSRSPNAMFSPGSGAGGFLSLPHFFAGTRK